MTPRPCSNLEPQPTVTRRSTRRAFTLVEMCMVIAVVMFVAAVATTLLHAMMRQQAAAGKQLLVGNSLMRLNRRFRQDVHEAVAARLDHAHQFTLMQKGDSSVSYTFEGAGTLRRTRQVGKDVRQDQFDLWANHDVSFAFTRFADSPKMITLSIHAAKSKANGSASQEETPYVISSRGTSIVAELSRDHRWNVAGGSSGTTIPSVDQ